MALFCSLCAGASSLEARVIRVPSEHLTIRSAVFAARGGDTVEVDDGTYFEECVRLDKRLTVRAKHPFRAVIYGGPQSKGVLSIFIVQAPVEISGFILKNARFGIIQRSSPDVAWTARQMLILNMTRAAVAINAKRGTIGRANILGVIADRCAVGFQTSEARSLNVRNCLASNCRWAFRGYSHVSFSADRVAVWNCGQVAGESKEPPGPGATHHISLGDVRVLTAKMLSGKEGLDPEAEIAGLLMGFEQDGAGGSLAPAGREVLEGYLSSILGGFYLEAGDLDRAYSLFQKALDKGRRWDFPELVWPSLQGLADAFRQNGDAEAALAHYERAVQAVDDMRSGYVFKLYNPGYNDDKVSLYESLLSVLYDLHCRRPEGGYGLLALEHIENSKARGFVQSLREADIFSASGLAGTVRPERMKIIGRINEIQIALQSRALTTAERAALSDKLEVAYEDIKSSYIRSRQDVPPLRQVPLFKAASAEEIRDGLLDARTILIEYFLGEKQSFGIACSKERLIFARLDHPQEISRLAARFSRYLNLRDGGGFAGAAGSRRLYRMLMAPFDELLEGGLRRIIVVPCWNLNLLPFEALLRNGLNNRGTGTFLIEDFEFVYAPSASALLVLQARPRRGDAPLDFLGIANPSRGNGNQVNFQTLRTFPPLHWARKEVQAAARSFPAERVRLLDGDTVSESRLLSQPLESFRVLHFAVHGIYDDVNWQRSTLLLDQDSDGRMDGFLQLHDMPLLSLKADLVVLSSCQSGLGRLERGEGLSAWSYSFLYTGARSLINSLWSISDESSVDFMRVFYSRLASGLTKSAALREAKREMLRGRYAHPFYWAGFILIGDDGPLQRR